nr:putative DNA methylase [uncultured Mediterranean phage uvMED]BAR37552.1 putative DNA methylase [uncultured Mediterranean phage uvMED]
MRVLIACEYSGIVRDAFAAKGHDAWSCDILPTESPGNHFQGDVLEHLDKGWDMMIAHPPCTYLSNAGARFLYPKGKLNEDRYKLGLKAKEFFMSLYNAPINKICVENPISSKIFALPKHTQTIQPYEYGHPIQKRTCLWLKNLSELKPTDIIFKRQSTKIPGNWFNKGGKDRQKNRSKFFDGFAKAMADQWGHDG